MLYLNCEDNNITLNKKQYLLRAAERLGLEVRDYKGGEVENILNIEPYNFKKGEKWTGVWEIDLLLNRPEMTTENWSQVDSIFTAISTLPPKFKDFKTQLLFQACDPELHTKIPIPLYDIVFSGSIANPCYEERRRVYDLIKKKFKFRDAGKGKNIQDYIIECNTAKIQFIRSMNTPIADGELAQRFFEGLAIGPVLTNWVEDLRYTFLIEDQDYMAYRNDEEMLEKINYLLKNPDKAEEIAENGRQKALLHHTYDNRLKTIYANQTF